VAWLSTDAVDAKDRLAGSRGWVNTRGEPVVDTVDDLVARKIMRPIQYDEQGSVQRPDDGIWTGTKGDGTAFDDEADCGDWESDVDGAFLTPRGHAAAVASAWTHSGNATCATARALFCFGVGTSTPVVPDVTAGRYAFLSPPWAVTGGLSGADSHCDDNKGSLPGTYLAALATTSASAADRFDDSGATWVRPDGIALAATAAELLGGGFLEAGINMAADGSYLTVPGTYVWTGSQIDITNVPPGVADTCDDWTLTTGTGRRGESAYTGQDDLFSWAAVQACTSTYRLLCMQE
jgi:hypothetical protein